MSKNIIAMSGGKDSTAMALLEAEKGTDFELLFTPAGNEANELFDHVNKIATMVDRPLVTLSNRNLDFGYANLTHCPTSTRDGVPAS